MPLKTLTAGQTMQLKTRGFSHMAIALLSDEGEIKYRTDNPINATDTEVFTLNEHVRVDYLPTSGQDVHIRAISPCTIQYRLE